MGGTELMEEIFCGNFFDQMDDLLDSPNDHADKELADIADFPPVFWSDNSSVFSSANSNSASNLMAELSVPGLEVVPYSICWTFVWGFNTQTCSGQYEDIVQFKWLSTPEKFKSSTNASFQNHFQTSPLSVLERSGACSKGITLPVSHAKRARSKRPRPATFNPRSDLIIIQTPRKRKKSKIVPSNGNAYTNSSSQELRCTHCEITKTPQWREGPMGPKTLCNACGVRYKSGRLFPEYRPAASPTFVPSLHSNSHRKVIEMRNKNLVEKSGNS